MQITQETTTHLIGDPTIGGWLIAIAYLIAAYLCFEKYQQYKKLTQPVVFWVGLGLFLFLLGINKQLDLQTVFLSGMKDVSKSHGWYEQRKTVQVAFIATLGLGFVFTVITARMALMASWLNQKRIWLGVILLFIFILLRAATFNKLSGLGNQTLLGFSVHSIAELAVISFIIVSIYLNQDNSNHTTKQLKTYAEGDNVFCPKCNRLSLTTATQGRPYKCKHCRHQYTISVQSL